MIRYIDVTVDMVTGNTEVEAHGFKGKGCVSATAEILVALGKTEQRKLKSDYHQREVQTAPRLKAGR